MKILPLHILKWWDVANDRRQRLINRKYNGEGITDAQEGELKMLQGVAELIMEYASPGRLKKLDLGDLSAFQKATE